MDLVATDALARGLAIYAAVVATVGLGWQIWTWTQSGGHLRVRRLKLKKHPSDPREHRVVVQVVNSGRLPIKSTNWALVTGFSSEGRTSAWMQNRRTTVDRYREPWSTAIRSLLRCP
jgi:hypothetical protein